MDEEDRIKVRRIFCRRRVSRDTFLYLGSIAPVKASAEEIAEKINANRVSVLGALRGVGARYKKEESLKHFGLVALEKKTIDHNAVLIYGLTPMGIEEKGLAKIKRKFKKLVSEW